MKFTRIRGEKVNVREGNEAYRCLAEKHAQAAASGGQDTKNARVRMRRCEGRARYEESACTQKTL